MKHFEYQELVEIQKRQNITQFRSLDNTSKTLIVGKNSDGHFCHVYQDNGRMYRVVYNEDKLMMAYDDFFFMPTDILIPYIVDPNLSDYHFIRNLVTAGYRINFSDYVTSVKYMMSMEPEKLVDTLRFEDLKINDLS